MTTIYADNAATTKLSKTALEAMMPYLTDNYGNPSSLHTVGQNAAEALFKARKTVADCIGADPKEIIFTGGGSEADNQALLTAAGLPEERVVRVVSSLEEGGQADQGALLDPING